MTSGTPTDWLEALPGLVELHCRCEPEIAAQRFLARSRHPAHGDQAKASTDVLTQLRALHRLGPIGIGPTVTVDTQGPLDHRVIADRILAARATSA